MLLDTYPECIMRHEVGTTTSCHRVAALSPTFCRPHRPDDVSNKGLQQRIHLMTSTYREQTRLSKSSDSSSSFMTSSRSTECWDCDQTPRQRRTHVLQCDCRTVARLAVTGWPQTASHQSRDTSSATTVANWLLHSFDSRQPMTFE